MLKSYYYNKAVLELGRDQGAPWPGAGGETYPILNRTRPCLLCELTILPRSLVMADLNSERCVACRGDSPPVTRDEMKILHDLVSDWGLITEDGINKLDRRFSFPDFQHALDFTVRLGALAEEEGHHPRLVTEWGGVTVTWWTHKIRDLHRNDFVMAAKSDTLYARSTA